jgi:hypothetical protein
VNKGWLKGAPKRRVLSTAIGIFGVAFFSSGGLQASLWTNGTVLSNSSICDSACTKGSPALTAYDNFTVGPTGWVVQQFVLTDFFAGTVVTEYSSTNWSIWSGEPLGGTGTAGAGATAGIQKFSGNVAGSAVSKPGDLCGFTGAGAPATCQVTITLNLPTGVFLPQGTYYLGVSNVLKGTVGQQDISYRAFATGSPVGALPGWEQSNGTVNGSNNLTLLGPPNSDNSHVFNTGETAFDINGVLAPEPATWALMSLALVGFIYKLRRRTA